MPYRRTAMILAAALLLPLWARAQQGGLRVPPMLFQVQRLRPGLTIVVSPNPPGSAAAPVVAVLTRVARPAPPGYQQTVTTIPAEQLTTALSTAAARVRGAARTVVVIAGAIATATVLAQAAHIFALPPAGPAPPDPFPVPRLLPHAPPPAPNTAVLPPAGPAVLTITWPGPPAGAKDTAALAMLGEDLFGGPAARERRSLVDKWRVALAVRGGLNGPAGWSAYRAPGHFLAQVWFRPSSRGTRGGAGALSAQRSALGRGAALGLAPINTSPTLVRELVFRQIHEIEVNGISPDELRRTEIWTAADWLRRGQTAAARARRLARAFWTTGSPQAANDALRPMLAVTAQQMQAAAARYLSDAAAHVSIGPAAPWRREPLARPELGPAASPVSAPAWLPAWRPPAPAFAGQFQNGLRLIVIRDANTPLLTAQLSVRAAPVTEARWSQALARVLLAGSTPESGAALAGRIQGIGGILWARAGRRRFTIGASALSPYAGILLRRLAAIAIRPAIPAAAVAREEQNAPAWQAWRQASLPWLARQAAARLLVSPAAASPPLEQKTLLAFAHQLLLPNNGARLVVVGNVDPAWVQSLAEQYFVDAWPFGNPPPPPRREKLTASRLYLVNVPGSRAAFAFVSAAALPPAGCADAAAWRLARLLALGEGAVSGAVPAAQLPDALRQALVRRARLAAAPVPAAQLQGLKARLLRQWMNAWQAQAAIAQAWTAGPPPAAWAAVAAVTPVQLQAAARRYLSPAVIAVAGDAKLLAAPLSRLRDAPVPILDPQGRRIGVYPPAVPARGLRRVHR